MPRLQDMVGQMAFMKIAFVEAPFDAMIHGHEPTGLWIESPHMSELLMAKIGVLSAPKTPVLFVPFARIDYILGSSDIPTLSDRALQ